MKPQSITPATALLDSLGISYSLHKYESLVSTDFGKEAASTMGLDEELVFKTILFGKAKTAVVAISPVSHKINSKMLAAAVNVRSIEPMDPQVAQRLTGYVRGGISPFGQKNNSRPYSTRAPCTSKESMSAGADVGWNLVSHRPI